MLNNKIYYYQELELLKYNLIDNNSTNSNSSNNNSNNNCNNNNSNNYNNDKKYYNCSYYSLSLEFLNNKISDLIDKTKIILKINDNIKNKEILNIIEKEINLEKKNEILKKI